MGQGKAHISQKHYDALPYRFNCRSSPAYNQATYVCGQAMHVQRTHTTYYIRIYLGVT